MLLLSLSSFRTSKKCVMYFTVLTMCAYFHMCLFTYICHIYMPYVCSYVYMCMSFVYNVFYNPMWLCAVCISMLCVYIYTYMFIYVHIYVSIYMNTHIYVCSCVSVDLPHKRDGWVSFLETRVCHSALFLHNISFHFYSLVSRPSGMSAHGWIITLGKAVMWGCLIEITLEPFFVNLLRIINKNTHYYFVLSVLSIFDHADQIYLWKLLNFMHSWIHIQQKSGLGYVEMEGSKNPGRSYGPPELSSCLPCFLVAKSNFQSPHMGWETAGVHTSSRSFGFLICETWPNILISVANKRLEEYRMGWINCNHQTHTGTATPG